MWAWTRDGFLDPSVSAPRLRRAYRELVDAYANRGDHFAECLQDPFAVVVADRRSGKVLAARDPVGSRSVFFLPGSLGVSLAWSATAFVCAPANPNPEFDRGWLASYLAGLPPEPQSTAIRGVRQVAPGELVRVESERVRTTRWHEFDEHPPLSGNASVALKAYRASMVHSIASARGDGDVTAVEVGVDAAGVVLAATTTTDLPRWDDRIRGIAQANFDVARDQVLDVAATAGIPKVEVTTGWPGKGLMWGRWYELAAQALGQPTHHAILLGIQDFEAAAQSGFERLLRVGGPVTGGSFSPLLGPLALRRGRVDLALRAQPRGFGARFRGIRTDLRSGKGRAELEAGPLLRGETTTTYQLADRWTELVRGSASSTTGYSDIGREGFRRGHVERLLAGSLIAAHLGVDVRYPMIELAVVDRLLRIPLVANSAGGVPGAALQEAFPEFLPATVDWSSRRRRGVERAKLRHEALANSQARARYLLENLNPLLDELIDSDQLRRAMRARLNAGSDHPRRSRSWIASTEFAHIEAANRWLNLWPAIH